MIFMLENTFLTVTLPGSGEECTCFLRYSFRAKRCILRVTEKGVELVLPPFMPEKEGIIFLESSSAWLEKTLKKREKAPANQRKKRLKSSYPSMLDLPALNKFSIPVYYTFLDVPWVGVKLDEENGCIRVAGNVLFVDLVGEAWERFIIRKAEEFLPEKLRQYSLQTGLKYKKCTVRMQRSRWGSCSTSGTISLNAMLLFVPEECVEYVLMHELCHTKYMDHSEAFWQEVAKYIPRWKYFRSLLKRTTIPLFR